TIPGSPRPGVAGLGEVSEWLKEQHWKCCMGLVPIGGSNPPLSAFDRGLTRKRLVFKEFFAFGARLPHRVCQSSANQRGSGRGEVDRKVSHRCGLGASKG